MVLHGVCPSFVVIINACPGIGAVPYCMPKSASKIVKNSRICNSLMETASHRAYSAFAQKHSFQANCKYAQKPLYHLARLQEIIFSKITNFFISSMMDYY